MLLHLYMISDHGEQMKILYKQVELLQEIKNILDR